MNMGMAVVAAKTSSSIHANNPYRGIAMDILHLVSTKPSLSVDELIERAARSWDPDFPGRDELPRKYADICRSSVKLALIKGQNRVACLHDLCRTRGIDESEVIFALEELGSRIELGECASGQMQRMQAALTSKTRDLWQRLR